MLLSENVCIFNVLLVFPWKMLYFAVFSCIFIENTLNFVGFAWFFVVFVDICAQILGILWNCMVFMRFQWKYSDFGWFCLICAAFTDICVPKSMESSEIAWFSWGFIWKYHGSTCFAYDFQWIQMVPLHIGIDDLRAWIVEAPQHWTGHLLRDFGVYGNHWAELACMLPTHVHTSPPGPWTSNFQLQYIAKSLWKPWNPQKSDGPIACLEQSRPNTSLWGSPSPRNGSQTISRAVFYEKV